MSFIFAFLFAVLLGTFPAADVYADADIDVPATLGLGLGDSADTGVDDPEESDEDKLVPTLSMVKAEVRKVVWVCRPADRSRPFFTGGRHALPLTNAPPAA